MSAPRKTHEPTMEDILSSIRKMVTEDMEARSKSSGGEEKPADAKKPDEGESDMSKTGAKSEILELTRMVNDDGTVTDLRQANKAVSAEDAKSEDAGEATAQAASGSDTPGQEPSKGSAPQAEAQQAEPSAQPATPQSTPPATSPAEPATAAGQGDDSAGSSWVGHNQTLEALVLEAIEPKIRAWLDANLDRMVREVLQQKVDVPADQLEKSAREMVRRELKAMLSRLDES